MSGPPASAKQYTSHLGNPSSLFASADEAVARIPNRASIAIGGSGSGHAIPDALLAALGDRFRKTGSPDEVTLLHPFGVGDQRTRGLQHIAEAGMYRRVVGGHWSMAPKMAELARSNAFPAYCLPAGAMIQMFHCAAAGSPGWMTHVGLHTFVDPRLEGGRINQKATESLVELVERDGQEWLLYPTIPVNVALIKAWRADPDGNLGMNEEAGWWHNLALAQAARATGGITLAVVRERCEAGSLHPRDVKVPGCFVDAIVVDPDAGQTFQTDLDPAYNGDARRADSEFDGFDFSARKAIARRAAQELTPGAVINVGFGVPDGVVAIAREQGFADRITTTIEHGQFGGIPALGLDFGAVWNPDAIVGTTDMFNFYQGRGVDQTFLGLPTDRPRGKHQRQPVGEKIVGVGGFIDISQKARKLAFCGHCQCEPKSRLRTAKSATSSTAGPSSSNRSRR